MQHSDSMPTEFVRRVGSLDQRFVAEYSTDLANADSYPYGVMSLFEIFLCQQWKGSIAGCKPLVRSAMDVIEEGLREHYDELQNMVEVAFIEKLFDDDNGLFKWMVVNSGPKLKYELLAFHATERAYRIINAVRGCFATPPDSIETIIGHQAFVKKLDDLNVPYDRLSMLDVWGHPYQYHLAHQRGQNTKILIWITSLASARGHGKDIETIG